MERSEPSLVPEWLRSKVGGGSSHHSTSSQADRKSSSNSPRSSSSNNNSSNWRDRNPNSRPYNNSSRNQSSKDREYLGDDDTWAFEYSNPLPSFTGRRPVNGILERSKSMISGRSTDPLQRSAFSDMRNRNFNINNNRNEPISVSTRSSYEKELSFYESGERSMTPNIIRVSSPGLSRGFTTPDITRVPSPGLSRGVQGLFTRSPPLIGSEGRTSVVAKHSVAGVGSNTICSPNGISALASASTAGGVNSNGFHKMEASVQAPGRSPIVQQTQRSEELSFVGSKKLIPMTSSVSQKMVLNPSDKLKPKTAARSNDAATVPKNGLHQSASTQLGSQTIPSLSSAASKNATTKHPTLERKTSASAYNSNAIPVADKRLSLAQIRSRHNFLNHMREKSLARSSSDAGLGTVTLPGDQKIEESKEIDCGSVGPVENGDGKCNGSVSDMAKSLIDKEETNVGHNIIINTPEEYEFLRSLGWEEESDEDDEGLTEEEINSFVNKYLTSAQAAKLLRARQLRMMSDSNSPSSSVECSVLSL